MATLYVNASTGDDSRSYATAQNSGTPWLTIGRACWGSSNRSTPDTSQAATAGDTVIITGSGSLGSPTLYTNSTAVNSNSTPLYLPVNSGTAGNYITFEASGYVQLGAPGANGPVLGNSGSIDYIKWYADRVDSRFIITCDARGGGTNDTKGDTAVVNTRPDTGPIFITGAAWIEGFDIDGGFLIDYGDNWEGIAVRNGTGYTIRNNWIHDFRKDEDSNAVEDTSHNQTGITLYGAQDGLIEHNLLTDNGAGIYWKDTLSYQPTFGNVVRRNWMDGSGIGGSGVSKGIAWSLVQTGYGHGPNFISQNVIVDCLHTFSFNAPCHGDIITNNTGVRCQVGLDNPFGGDGVRIYNNIFYDCDYIIYQDGVNAPASTSVDWQHNVYFSTNTTHLEDASGSHTFAQFKAEYTDQDIDDPDSITSDPLFTDYATEDFTLQSGSPARSLGIDLNDIDGDANTSEANDAGAYQFGIAVTIGLTDDPAEPPPDPDATGAVALFAAVL